MYFAVRIDVDHAVLDVCKITFDRFMDIFGDGMRFQQSQVIVGAYFYIDIDAAAEFAGLQYVDMVDAFCASIRAVMVLIVASSQERSTILSMASLKIS